MIAVIERDLESLRSRGFIVQDLVAVGMGLKPMCRFGLTSQDPQAWLGLDKFCRASGLVAKRYRLAYEGTQTMVGVSRDRGYLEQYASLACRKAESRSQAETVLLTRQMGRHLGYPVCCVEAFCETEKVMAAAPWCFPLEALARSGQGPYSFAMNFLYNLHSRSSSSADELRRLLRGGYRAADIYLLPWIPCSLKCKSSMRYGQRLYRELQRLHPSFARQLRSMLCVTLLFYSDWEFVALAGAKRRPRGWDFAGVFDFGTLLDLKVVSVLRQADALVIKGHAEPELRRGASALGTIPAPKAIFDFAGN